MLERIQKIISAAGITSRRAAEELITEGRVRVNGTVVTELGTKADASKDHIKVDGKLINPKQPPTYLMLNKPAGFVTTMSDPEGRPTVQDLLKGIKVRVYPVGRLDYNTEGLLLMTNDGDFAHLITHPKHEFPKTYLAKVKGVVEDGQIDNLEKGIYLDDGKTAPAKIKKIRKEEANSWLEITIHEGRKRQVRRMFDRVGHSVIKLKRIKTGNLMLGDLAEGSYRYLTPAEVLGLREASEKTEVRLQKPAVKSQKSDVRSVDKKRAHRGRMPDARPGRAVWSEEKKQGTGDKRTGARGQGSGFRSSTSRPGGRTKGPGYKSLSARPNVKSEWRGTSSGSRGQGTGFRSSSSRPGSKPTGRRSIPKTRVKVERSGSKAKTNTKHQAPKHK
jgi:23S rRNA pseudouridine2605 synthase